MTIPGAQSICAVVETRIVDKCVTIPSTDVQHFVKAALNALDLILAKQEYVVISRSNTYKCNKSISPDTIRMKAVINALNVNHVLN